MSRTDFGPRVTWARGQPVGVDRSFLGLRALGRGPLQQFIWLYDRDIDLDGLRRFHQNLGNTLLGRLIARSPLPFGRHRWVAAPVQAELGHAPAPRPRSELQEWLPSSVSKAHWCESV